MGTFQGLNKTSIAAEVKSEKNHTPVTEVESPFTNYNRDWLNNTYYLLMFLIGPSPLTSLDIVILTSAAVVLLVVLCAALFCI